MQVHVLEIEKSTKERRMVEKTVLRRTFSELQTQDSNMRFNLGCIMLPCLEARTYPI